MAAQQGGSVVVTVVLARILTPGDFGLVAVATIVTTFFTICGQIGFGPGLISRDRVDQAVVSTAFWATAGVGIVLAGICAAGSPLLADLLGAPSADGLIAASSITVLVMMLSEVPKGLLLREMQFRRQYVAVILGAATYVVVALALAVTTELGAWVIVLGRIAATTTQLVAQMIGARMSVTATFDRDVFVADLGFSGGFFVNILSIYGAKNVDYWVVSRQFGPTTLGIYYIAYVLPNVLRARLTELANELMTPVFARRSTDATGLRDTYHDLVSLMFLAASPVLVGIALLSTPVIELFFGDQWADAAGPMSLLALTAAIEIINQIANTMLIALRRPGVASVLNIMRFVVLGVGAVIGAVRYESLMVVAGAVTASAVCVTVGGLYQIRREASIPPSTTFAAILPAMVSCAVMAAGVVGFRATVDLDQPVADIAASAAVGAPLYAATLAVGFRSPARRAMEAARSFAGRPAR